MEVDLLDFVEQCRRLVKQALGKHAGEPASGGFARWKHVVLHCLRLEDGHSYRETPNRLKYMAEIRDALGLDPDDLPDYSTIYKSFDRLKMWVWRALLRVSAQQHPQSEHAALDSTFFDRRRASSYFRQRAGRTIQTLKVTTLTDVESLAVLDVHTLQLGGSTTRRRDRRSSAETRTTCSRLPPTTASKTGTPSTRSPHTTSITSFIIAARQRTQPRKRSQPGKRLLSAVDGRNIVFDNEALARRRRASAGLVSTVP